MSGPALSVVLATDSFATIEPVVRCLRAQTAAAGVELVIVAPDPEAARRDAGGPDGLGSIVVLPTASPVHLAPARAIGVRAATAPVVFVGETHTYPEERWAETLIAEHASGDWSAVVPGFGNANPSGALSWAAFLTDYGAWLGLLERRELELIPTYNTAYRRADLLALEPRLDLLLTTGDELIVELRAADRRFLHQPAARLDHANVDRPRPWLAERYLGGLLTAHSRMVRWSWRRRLLYAAGSPLIPVVVLARIRHGVAAARRAHGISLAVYPALLLGAVLSAAGELVAYAGGPVERGERTMTGYEIHRRRYLRG